MPITLKPFAELDDTVVASQVTEATTRIQEDNPTLDLRIGPFYSTIVLYHGALSAQLQTQLIDYNAARSLKVLNENPEAADADLVDDVLSNYRLTRLPGSKAHGQITIVVANDITVTIGIGAVFVSGGNLRYVATDVFTAKSDPNHISLPGDRLLTKTPDGKFAFVIDVEAEEEGAQYQIKKDTLVVPLVQPNNYVNSYATADFTGGATPETNTELLQRLQEGVATKSLSGRTAMQAMLRSVTIGENTVRSSVIGYGDQEMLRDAHTIWPMSMGGRADWYIRTVEEVVRFKLTKEATCVLLLSDGTSVWQFAIGRDDAPGFYEVDKIRLANADSVIGGFEIVLDQRSTNLLDYEDVPDIAATAEGMFTRFQTAIIRFVDNVSANVGIGMKATYEMEARYLPDLDVLQDYFGSRKVRNHAADLLIKAPIPCFLTLHFTVVKQAGDVDPDVTGIQTAICTEINNIGFIGRLYAAQLYDVVHGYLTNAMSVTKIDMQGRLRYPDGSTKYIRNGDVLKVPDEPTKMVSPKTVQFFVSPEDVVVSIETTIPLDP